MDYARLLDKLSEPMVINGTTYQPLFVGPFDKPLTPEQREQVDTFKRTAELHGRACVHIDDELFEVVSAAVPVKGVC